ncbi:MAG TPA: Mpo1-like protein [Burkholderiaceae bacterium]|nr:Mpo1-like protein [Burkholderiaceae bacterium]
MARPAPSADATRFASFAEFYPFYLSEHADRTCRRLHFVGSTLVLACLVAAIVLREPWWLAAMPVIGYGFAWIGHFAFERNRPATFRYPLWSLAGDWVMYRDMLTGRIRF